MDVPAVAVIHAIRISKSRTKGEDIKYQYKQPIKDISGNPGISGW